MRSRRDSRDSPRVFHSLALSRRERVRARAFIPSFQCCCSTSITTTLLRFGQFLDGNRFAKGKAARLSRAWAGRHEEAVRALFLRSVVVILVAYARVLVPACFCSLGLWYHRFSAYANHYTWSTFLGSQCKTDMSEIWVTSVSLACSDGYACLGARPRIKLYRHRLAGR